MEYDKKLHLLVGLAMGVLFPFFMSMKLAIFLGLAIGAGKEVYDYLMKQNAIKKGVPPRNTPDVWDFAYTAAGVIVPVVIKGLFFV